MASNPSFFDEITLTSIGSFLATAIIVVLMFQWPDWRYSALAVVVGGLVGWLLGVLFSPYVAEKELFASYAKAALAFATGFLVSKLDRVFELLMDKKGDTQPLLIQDSVWRPFLFGICSLLVLMIYVFTCRHYGQRAEADAAKAKADADAAKATAVVK
jgi:hypothetical protein